MAAVDLRTSAHLVRSLRRAHFAIEADREHRLRTVGLTAGEYGVLELISERPGLVAVELARVMVVPRHRAGYAAARLHERELLQWLHGKRKDRTRGMYLTGAGEELLAQASALLSPLEEHILNSLGESHSTQLRKLLDRLSFETQTAYLSQE